MVSGKIELPRSILIDSYSPGFGPESNTFLTTPFDVPKNANVFGPVVAAVTDVIDSLSKSNREYATIGATPLILRPTLQKLYTFPIDYEKKKIQILN